MSAMISDQVKYYDQTQLRAMLGDFIADDNVADVIEAGSGEITGHTLPVHDTDAASGDPTAAGKPIKSAGSRVEPTEVIVAQHDADRQLRGVKSGLKAKVAKLSVLEFHKHYGHLGCCEDCVICRFTKGAARRIYQKVDPHCETRPGFCWHMDTVTWDTRSMQGNVYMTVLRDEASGVFKVLIHYLKSDSPDMLERFVTTIRADPAFHDCPYKVFSELHLDNAGEWALNCTDFQRLVQDYGIRAVYSCPDRKQSASRAERACGIVEIVIKSLLMQNNLPAWWWENCAHSAEFLLNRFPTASAGPNIPTDGDRVRPLEFFSRFTYSRRQIDRELSYYLSPGTPALVQTKAKGSELGPKTRWGIAKAMYREQVIFICPYSQTEFRSKSFAAFRLQDGLNYLQFLGLPEVETARGRVAIPVETTGTLVIKLPKHKELKVAAKPAVIGVEVKGSMQDNPPDIEYKPNPTSELGGQMKIFDSHGKLTVGPDLQSLDGAHIPTEERAEAPSLLQNSDESAKTQPVVVVKADAKIDKLFDIVDAQKVAHKGVFTDGTESLVRVCKTLGLVFEQNGLYRAWLISECGVDSLDLPEGNYAKLKAGLKLPYPSGGMWRQAVKRQTREWRRAQFAKALENDRACVAAEQWIHEELDRQRATVNAGGKFCFQIQSSTRAMAVKFEVKGKIAKTKLKTKRLKGKRAVKAVASGVTPAPKTCRAALEGDDNVDWVASQGKEFYPLVEMGVLDCGYTRQQLRDEGVINPDTPTPIGDYYELKFDADGNVNKKKSRFAIKGHPGNMQKGVHYDLTFSATPRENTARLICALVVLLNLNRSAFDITKAYCWADRPKDKLLALKYPDGFQEYDPVTGEELFIILRKNLYGDPAAGRLFGKARDKVILEKFNADGWTCSRCKMDPCLFVIQKEGKRAWMLAHVDDCDIAGEGQDFCDSVKAVCATIWKITDVDPEYMLGIRRRLCHDSAGRVTECNMDMIAYVEGMAEAFKEHLPKGTMREPVPKGTFISKIDTVTDQEAQAVLDAGYQVAVGMLMWAVRQCYPGGKVAVSMLCRVMARPHWAAFAAAMHLIAWLFQNRTLGIKFSHCCNTIPIMMVDASNKPDPSDGKAQFGGLIMFMGAAVIDVSRKLKHVGMSSAHNEYMAMYYMHQTLIWFRQLLGEMGLQNLIAKPTITLADNLAANTLSHEDVVTHGNQYMYLPFHYNKEVQEQGFSWVEYINTLLNIADLMTKAGGSKEMKGLMGALTGHDTRLVQYSAAAGCTVRRYSSDSGDSSTIQGLCALRSLVGARGRL